MQAIVRVPFTVDSTNVAKPDAAAGEVAWAAGGTYARFQLAYRPTTELIYQARTALSGDTVTPEDWVLAFSQYAGVEGAYASFERWREYGPCNANKMFDQATGTITLRASPLIVELLPSAIVDGIYLGDVDAESVQVQVFDGATEVYDTTVDMTDFGDLGGMDEYFFAGFESRSEIVLTDLPAISGARVVVTVSSSAPVGVGTCLLGNLVDFGDTVGTPTVSTQDYSEKTVNTDTGATTIKPGPSSKRISFTVACPTNEVDLLVRTLTRLQALPSVWLGAPGQFECMSAYGTPKTWSMVPAYEDFSQLTVNIEELT